MSSISGVNYELMKVGKIKMQYDALGKGGGGVHIPPLLGNSVQKGQFTKTNMKRLS